MSWASCRCRKPVLSYSSKCLANATSADRPSYLEPALPGMDRSPRLGTSHRRSARPAHPSRSHPGDERRQLSPQAKPQKTLCPTLRLARPPNAPRGRRASFAPLQSPFYPEILHNLSTNHWTTLTPPTGLILLRP